MKNKGFTLFEMIITLVVVGVLTALFAPNMIAMNRRIAYEEFVKQVKMYIVKVERESVRTSSQCTIEFGTKEIKSNCGRGEVLEVPDFVKVKNNEDLDFDFRGSAYFRDNFYLYFQSDYSPHDFCFEISLIGSVAIGDYKNNKCVSLGYIL